MNIFCFSLEGSTDSLYEAPQTNSGPTCQSPMWVQSEICVNPEPLQTPGGQCKTDLKKGKIKSCASELARFNDEAGDDPYMMNCSAQRKRIEKKEKEYNIQVVESKTQIQTIHKLVTSSAEQSGYPSDISSLIKRPTKKFGKESNQQPEPESEKEMDGLWNPQYFHDHWSSMDTCSFWELHHHCHRPTVDPWNGNLTLPRGSNRHQYKELIYDLDLPGMEYPSLRVIRSFTDMDITDTMRSYSFGRFDTSKKQSAVEEQERTLGHCADGDSAEGDHIKGGLGKKMKAISLTMRKKMGKKYARALSEEMVEGGDDQEAEVLTNANEASAKVYTNSRNSVESLISPYSGQSSFSSGITSGSEGLCHRDSLRLEEEVVDTIHFCGKAKVHTNFLPSPYDTESLKLKVGDMIDIISKPPMGIWTGMLNGKVGTFKFIYVDVLHEEPAPVHRMGNHRRSKRPRPKTLQEFLERLNLEEYMSSLLLNGYQTVDDLKDLKEQHLIELNVTDPEQRNKLLAATDCLHDAEAVSHKEAEGKEVPKSQMVKTEPNDCPRDSGCYVASDCSDHSSKEEAENLLPAPSVHISS